MLPRFDGQYLFLLPLPVRAPGVNTALGGVVYAITDANCKIIGKKEIIVCKGPDYLLPSPRYLLAQGIDPHNLQRGLCEFDFYHKVKTLIGNGNLDVITWSVRNLQALNAIALRIFDRPLALTAARSLSDANKVLRTASVFAGFNNPRSDLLVRCAQSLGFENEIKTGDNFAKLDALIHIVSTLSDQAPQLLSFFLRPFSAKRLDYQKATDKGKFLVDLNFKSGQIEILLPISCSEHLLDALVFKEGKVIREYKLLSDAGLLAPSGILTKERQLSAAINLDSAVTALYEAKETDSYDDARKLPYWLTFFEKLNQQDLKELPLMQCNNPMSFTAPPLACSKFFKDRVFLCRGGNALNSMLPQEKELYYKTCSAMLKRQLQNYAQETSDLTSMLKASDEQIMKLLRSIERYPYDL